MRTMKRIFTLITLIALSITVLSAPLRQNGKYWLDISLSGEVGNSPFQYLVNHQLRLQNGPQLFQEAIFRGGIGYTLHPNIVVWLGTDLIPNINVNTDALLYEQRIWQQASVTWLKHASFNFATRSRLEERFRHGQTGVGLRWRQRFALTINHLNGSKYSPIISDELLLLLNHPTWLTDRVVDQNRFLIGVKMPCTPHVAMTIGYLNQFLFRAQGDAMNHILYVAFSARHNIG